MQGLCGCLQRCKARQIRRIYSACSTQPNSMKVCSVVLSCSQNEVQLCLQPHDNKTVSTTNVSRLF